jgi:predicted metal-binding membrane protein
MPELSLREIAAHPVSKATAVVGVLGGALNLPVLAAIWTTIWAQIGTVFTVTSIFGFTIAPEIPAVDTELAKIVALLAAGLYAMKKLLDVFRAARARINETQSDT